MPGPAPWRRLARAGSRGGASARLIRAREHPGGSSGGWAMGASVLPLGLGAGDCQSSSGRRMSACLPRTALSFLLSLLLATPGARAAGYEVSGPRGRSALGSEGARGRAGVWLATEWPSARSGAPRGLVAPLRMGLQLIPHPRRVSPGRELGCVPLTVGRGAWGSASGSPEAQTPLAPTGLLAQVTSFSRLKCPGITRNKAPDGTCRRSLDSSVESVFPGCG